MQANRVFRFLKWRETMSEKPVPVKVRLREERRWVAHNHDIGGVQAEGEWREYQKRDDAELLEVIRKSREVSEQLTFCFWSKAAQAKMPKKYGVYLVPGQIQQAANLPVRQVYRHDCHFYLIEADGKIGRQLL